MRKRKRKALAELEDVHETGLQLLKETAKSRCGCECAADVFTEQIKTIRRGITKSKKHRKRNYRK